MSDVSGGITIPVPVGVIIIVNKFDAILIYKAAIYDTKLYDSGTF